MKHIDLFDKAPKEAKALMKAAAKLKRERLRKESKALIDESFDGTPTKADYRAAFKKGSK